MIVQLPDDFRGRSQCVSNTSVTVYPYRSAEEVVKSKVHLQAFLFSFLLEGTKFVHLLGDQATVHADSFLLLKPTNCLMTERFKVGEEYQSLLCFFESDLLNDFAAKHQLALDTAVQSPEFLQLPIDDFVRHFIASLQVLLAQPSAKASAIWTLKVEELLLYLISQYGDQVVAFLMSSPVGDVDAGFQRTIEANVDNKLSLDELAFLCKMSLSSFKRKFRALYQESPARWFQKQRLQKAKLLLTHYQQSPSEVYEEAGFENFSSFSQAFKKEFGQSPKAFLNRQ